MPQKRVKHRRIGTGEDGIVPRRAATQEGWGMDFVQNRTADGRPCRMLVVLVDEYTRKCLAIEVHLKTCGVRTSWRC